MCVVFYSSFVCIFACANVYFKTTFIKQNIKIILIAGVPKSQALPGFLITAPPSVCVPDVIGALAVWIQNKKKTFFSEPVLFLGFFFLGLLAEEKNRFWRLQTLSDLLLLHTTCVRSCNLRASCVAAWQTKKKRPWGKGWNLECQSTHTHTPHYNEFLTRHFSHQISLKVGPKHPKKGRHCPSIHLVSST